MKLTEASRNSSPATTEQAIIVNGLATGQAVEDDEGHGEGNAEGDKPAQTSRVKYGFVHWDAPIAPAHNSLNDGERQWLIT